MDNLKILINTLKHCNKHLYYINYFDNFGQLKINSFYTTENYFLEKIKQLKKNINMFVYFDKNNMYLYDNKKEVSLNEIL